ncbi:MAG: hypothetical protein WA975_03545 [Mesorhizobium sp.]
MSYIDRPASFALPAAYQTLGNEPAGLGLDFCAMQGVVCDPATPANNWLGDPNAKLTYSSPSTKWITNGLGQLVSGTTLRCDHDPATLDTSSTPLVSFVTPGGLSRTVTIDGAAVYTVGQIVRLTDAGNISQWMLGKVTAFNAGTKALTINIYAASGVFTCSSWVIIVALGILIEEQRTNLLKTNSSTLAGFSTDNIVRTDSGIASPIAGVNYRRVEISATGTASFYLRTSGIGVTGPMTYSIYIKKGNGAAAANRFTLRNQTTGVDVVAGTVDYDTGALSGTGAAQCTMTKMADGGWRLTMTALTGFSAGDEVRVYAGFVGNHASAGDYMLCTGVQIEAGSFATSYIPTTGAQVTRAADNIRLATAAFPFNPSEGTLAINADVQGKNSLDNRVAVIANASALERALDINRASSGAVNFTVMKGGSATSNISSVNTDTLGQPMRLAGVYKVDDFAGCLNGGTVVIGASGAVAGVVTALYLGAYPTNIRYLNGHLRSLIYFPRRASNAELQAMTA